MEGTELGSRLVELHCFRDVYPADGSLQIHGEMNGIDRPSYDLETQQIQIGLETFVGPVSEFAWNYSISGYGVIRQWINKRSHLEFTLGMQQELLNIIWIVERTVDTSALLDDILMRLIEGDTLEATEIQL